MDEKLADANATAMKKFAMSFNPEDTDADAGKIDDAAADLETFSMRILGRSEDLNGAFGESVVELSNAIGWNITGQSGENFDRWTQAALAVEFCSAETSSWAEAVRDFKKERSNQIAEWDDKVGWAAAQLPPIKRTPLSSDDPCVSIESQYAVDDQKFVSLLIDGVREKKEALEKRAKENHDKLIDQAEDHGNRVAEGVTVENIRRLVQGGHMGWSAYNLKPEWAVNNGLVPLGKEQAKEDAKTIDDYHRKGKELDDEYYEALIRLQAVLSSSGDMLKNPDTKSEAFEYIDTFFNALNQQAGEGNLLDYLLAVDDEEARKTFGEGVLAWSNEDYGGGFDRLPEELQNAASGPHEGAKSANGIAYRYGDWGEDIARLSNLFEHVGPTVEGGTEFSLRLTSSIGGVLDPDFEFPDADQLDLSLYEKQFDDVLDVSLRNKDANYFLLDGGAEEHPAYGGVPDHPKFDREDVIVGLFTYEWEDGGQTVSELTNWVSEDANCGDPVREEKAARAAAGLINMITDEGGIWEELKDTEKELEDDDTAAFTRYNQHIAGSLASVFTEYIQDFAAAYNDYIPGSTHHISADQEDSYLFREEGDVALNLTDGTENRFVQLLVANEELAPNIFASVELYEEAALGEYLINDEGVNNTGFSSGRLRDMVDKAMVYEYDDRIDDVEEAKKQAKEKSVQHWETAYGTAAAVGSGAVGIANPGGGAALAGIAEIGKSPFKDFVGDTAEKLSEDDFKDPEIQSEFLLESDADVERHVAVQALNILWKNEILDESDFEGTNILVDVERNGEVVGKRPPASLNELGANKVPADSVVDQIYDDVFKKIGIDEISDVGGRSGMLDSYIQEYTGKVQGEYTEPNSED